MRVFRVESARRGGDGLLLDGCVRLCFRFQTEFGFVFSFINTVGNVFRIGIRFVNVVPSVFRIGFFF